MKTQLSILIPTYNYVCLPLVRELHRQASEMGGLEFEIVVAEDGSDQPDDIAQNAEITALRHCRHIVCEQNVGRAVIRNHLADMANMPWLLFVDSDMRVVSPHFVERYLQTPDEWGVVYGGNTTHGGAWNDERLLRVRYEQAAERQFTPQQRTKHPYNHLTTSNVFVAKRIMLAVPFDSRFQTYGYEDVFWGMSLAQKGIEVAHIENPVGFNHYDSNVVFVGKTIEGLHTLYTFRSELANFSPIIRLEQRLRRWRLDGAVRSVLNRLMPLLHRRIIGFKPSLVAFKLFKLCTYLHIAHADDGSKT
jgi:glycosyltransferase, group 2 family